MATPKKTKPTVRRTVLPTPAPRPIRGRAATAAEMNNLLKPRSP